MGKDMANAGKKPLAEWATLLGAGLGAALPRSQSPLVSYYAYAGGYRWHWRQTHDSFPGQPVVLVHGLLTSHFTLLPLAETIAGWAPVLVPDLPGFGLSEGASRALSVPELAAALAEWMRMAGASPAHVLGSSFGCQIAAELAAHFPQRVRSLTLVGPTLDPEARDFRSQAVRLLADLPREPVRLWLDHARGYARSGMRRVVGTFRAMLHDRIESNLPGVRAPSLVLRGASDRIAPEAWTRHAAQLLANGALAYSLAGGAHGVHFSHPALVACALRKFTFPFRNAVA